ncbi:hypothetical protein ACFRLW_21090 [Streptomyces sp. NPDC056728]|uniref:hypothetical protein n=1 Tax=Paenibacillus chitinolyticus TaxID=79263 RepID=UPI003672BBFA
MDLTRRGEAALAAMPDGVHEETLALIGDIAANRAAGRGAAVDALLRGRAWISYLAMGGLLVVVDVGWIG